MNCKNSNLTRYYFVSYTKPVTGFNQVSLRQTRMQIRLLVNPENSG